VASLFARVPHHATTVALFVASGFAIVGAVVSALRLVERPVALSDRTAEGAVAPD
jgi:hypothetical protein